MNKIAFFYKLGHTIAKEAGSDTDTDRIFKRTLLSSLAGGLIGGTIGGRMDIPQESIKAYQRRKMTADKRLKELNNKFFRDVKRSGLPKDVIDRVRKMRSLADISSEAESALTKLRFKNLAKGGLIGAALLGGLSFPFHYYSVKKD